MCCPALVVLSVSGGRSDFLLCLLTTHLVVLLFGIENPTFFFSLLDYCSYRAKLATAVSQL